MSGCKFHHWFEPKFGGLLSSVIFLRGINFNQLTKLGESH